jgi:hypothetical protein
MGAVDRAPMLSGLYSDAFQNILDLFKNPAGSLASPVIFQAKALEPVQNPRQGDRIPLSPWSFWAEGIEAC